MSTAAKQRFNWGDEVEGSTLKDSNIALPEDTDEFDEGTNIRTIVTHRFNSEGKVVKTTRKMKRRKNVEKVKQAVLRRRQLPKFGDVAGQSAGLESNVTYRDQTEFYLTLDGTKEEEKSDMDNLLGKIDRLKTKGALAPKAMNKPGFLFAQSKIVRETEGEVNSSDGIFHAPRSRAEDDAPTLRVSNLSEYATDKDVYDLFSKFGYVSRTHLARDRITNASRGYAFVTFMQKDEAQKALDYLDGYGYDNLILRVEWSKSMSQYRKERETKGNQ